ncbi:MAG TPA: response regulator [Aggregatilineales bacterium]|nr:response regulator [Aggregatilineales bacterium]
MENAEKPRVLVVDDDPALQKLVSTLLQRAGMDSVGALTAATAADVLKQRPFPNVIILDMMLPDTSGIEFLKQMRSKEVFNDLPVVILSALADPDQIREALNSGADRYLTKPYIVNNLISTVQDLVRNGRPKK